MEDLIKKLANLSSFNLSEKEVSSFKKYFSDIIPLIDKISDFPVFEDTSTHIRAWDDLRDDTPKNCDFKFKTNKVSRII